MSGDCQGPVVLDQWPHWRPIATAPKNGTPILAWVDMGGIGAGPVVVAWGGWPQPSRWRTIFGEWTLYASEDPLDDDPQPTHWLPLPPAPGKTLRVGEGVETTLAPETGA